MTSSNGFPEDLPERDPGAPSNTDPEATDADSSEAAAEEAGRAAREGLGPDTVSDMDAQLDAERPEDTETIPFDPALEAELDEVFTEVLEDEAAAQDAAADMASAEAEDNAEAVSAAVANELAERTEDLQRLSAEYANYRRRTERERQVAVDGAKAQVLSQFLPILDDLELARQHGDLEDGPLKAIANKLEAVLSSQKLEPFGAEGDSFDPEIHEAVQDLSSGGEQVIGTVLRRGYRVGDKLVRNAMVIIADPVSES